MTEQEKQRLLRAAAEWGKEHSACISQALWVAHDVGQSSKTHVMVIEKDKGSSGHLMTSLMIQDFLLENPTKEADFSKARENMRDLWENGHWLCVLLGFGLPIYASFPGPESEPPAPPVGAPEWVN